MHKMHSVIKRDCQLMTNRVCASRDSCFSFIIRISNAHTSWLRRFVAVQSAVCTYVPHVAQWMHTRTVYMHAPLRFSAPLRVKSDLHARGSTHELMKGLCSYISMWHASLCIYRCMYVCTYIGRARFNLHVQSAAIGMKVYFRVEFRVKSVAARVATAVNADIPR